MEERPPLSHIETFLEIDSPGSPGAETPPSHQATIFLNHVQFYERLPKDLLELWEAVPHDEPTSTARIFSDEGRFAAWFAYFCVKRAADQSTNFVGKADCKRLIADLDDADVDARKQLAAEVVAALPDEQIKKIEQLRQKLNTKIQSRKRDTMSQPAKRRRTVENNPPPASETTQRYPTPSPNPGCTATEQSMIHPSPNDHFFAEYEQVIVNPPLAVSRALFPDDLSNSIGTIPDPIHEDTYVAAISMAFPPKTGIDDCQMVLEITHDKVQHFAQRWFGARLESKDGLRYSVAPDGSKIVPYPCFTLTGVMRHILQTDFGQEVSHAITKSPRCQDDAKHVRARTDSVSMVVSAEANAGAQVTLSLGLFEGSRIKDKLFV